MSESSTTPTSSSSSIQYLPFRIIPERIPSAYLLPTDDQIDPELICPICFDVFTNPVSCAGCCSSLICARCIEPLTSCPFCRGTPDPLVDAPEALLQKLRDLPVLCKDCNQYTTLGTFKVHYFHSCFLPCPHSCGQSFARISLALHQATCTTSPTTHHWWSVGSKFTIPNISDWFIHSIEGDIAWYTSGPWGSHVEKSYNNCADRNYLTRKQLQDWLDDGLCIFIGV